MPPYVVKREQMSSGVKDSKASQSTSETTSPGGKEVDEQLLKDLNSWIDDLRDDVLCASENGLFTKQGAVSFGEIMDLLSEAPLSLNAPKSEYFEARSNYNKARNKFDMAIQEAGSRWRLEYCYGIRWFIYLVAVLIAVFMLVWLRPLPLWLTLVPVPKRAIMWGVIGSVLQGFWALWQAVSHRDFRRFQMAWFLAVPFIGGLLGAVMYLAFVAGVVAATRSTLQDPTLPLLVAALAGFSWKWAVGVLENLAEIFKGGKSEG